MIAANGTALAGRLARLEQQVASLLGQVGGGEQLSPNYLTVNAQGQVGASFTGQVTAQGINIEAAAIPTQLNQVRWLRQSNGAVLAFIQGSDEQSNFGAGSALVFNARDPDAPGNPVVDLALFGGLPAGAGNNSIELNVDSLNTMTLLDDLGRSNWLQLDTNPSTPVELVIDANNNSLYVINSFVVPANSNVAHSFSSNRGSWTSAVPLGAIGLATGATWQYSFTAPNTFSINFNNSTAVAQTVNWVGVIVGF